MSSVELRGMRLNPTGVSSSSAPAPQIVINIPKELLPQDLSVGESVEARVVLGPKSEGSNIKVQKGIEINGKFIPIDGLENLEVGQKVELTVLKREGENIQIALRPFPQTSKEITITKPSSVNLELVLKLLEQARSGLEDVRSAFSFKPLPFPKNPEVSTSLPTLTETDFKTARILAEKLRVLTKGHPIPEFTANKTFSVPDLKLRQYEELVLKEAPPPPAAIARFAQLIKSIGEKASDLIVVSEKKVIEFVKAHVESFQTSEAKAKELLKISLRGDPLDLVLYSLKRIEDHVTSAEKPRERELVAYAKDLRIELENKRQEKAPEPELRKVLTDALKKIQREYPEVLPPRSKETSTSTEAAELTVPAQRLLKSLVSQVRVVLDSPEPLVKRDPTSRQIVASPQLEALLKTLKTLSAGNTPPQSAPERILYDFSKTLFSQLTQLFESQASEASFRQALQGALEKFNLKQMVGRDFQDLLKVLNTSLNESIASFHTGSAIISPELFETFKELDLKQTLPNLNKAERQLLAEVKKIVELFSSSQPISERLPAILQGFAKLPAENIRPELTILFEKAKNQISEQLQQAVSRSDVTLVNKLFPQATRSIDENTRYQLLKDPEVLALLRLIKVSPGFKELIRTEGKNDGFLQFLDELSTKLDGQEHEKASKESISKPSIQRALEKLREVYQTQKTGKFDPSVTPTELKLLKSLESMVKTQEFLSHMNPLMQTAGEPIMLLFPTILQGLMSKVEMVYYPPGKQPEMVDNDSKKKQQGQGQCERFDVQVQLPTMGEVQVAAAWNKNEVSVTIVSPSEEVAEFLSARLNRLTIALKAAGFSNVNCKAEPGTLNTITPAWCSELAKPARIVA